MAVIKRADADTHLCGRVTLNLGDLDHRGRMICEAAAAEAERIVNEAHAERRRLIERAEAEGRAAGHAEGFEQGLTEGRERGRADAVAEYRERLSDVDASWAAAMQEFIAQRQSLLSEARRGALDLALAIAERVVHRQIELDPTVALDQVEAVLGLVTTPATLIVRLHPNDEPLVAEALPSLHAALADGTHVRLEPDASLPRGSCVARTLGGSSINADISTQLDRIARDLLPDRPRPDGGPPETGSDT